MTRLLYVEDNDDNVYMLKMRLELLDEFEVLVAEDGEKGCAAALEHKPELILMDLDLPVVDGWEATRRLKSDPRTRDIPMIALSAHALAGAREKAIEAGCDEFDTKPVEFERLLGKIRQLLRRESASLGDGNSSTLKLASRYSITSSASASIDGGTARPSGLAALRLMTISNSAAWVTGRSDGFSPLRMRAT